jgi:hypothetical protein
MPAAQSTLNCQACGAPLRLDDDTGGGAVHCSFCGAWTSLPEAPQRRAPGRPVVEKPRAIRVEDTLHGVRLVRRWFSPVYVFLVFFCAIWDGILLMFYGVLTVSGAPLFAFLFPLIHVAVGIGLTYTTLCGFVNRTVVEVDRDDMLTVRHGPLPWPGAASIPIAEIAQIFVTEKRSTSKNGNPSSTYAVNALAKSGRRVTLVKGLLSSLDHALFIEQELERRLRIVDRPVVGEIARE